MRLKVIFSLTNRCAQWIPDVILDPKSYSRAIFLNWAKKPTRLYSLLQENPCSSRLSGHVFFASGLVVLTMVHMVVVMHVHLRCV